MSSGGADIFPFYVFSGVVYAGLIWFVVDVVLVRTGFAYRNHFALGPKLNSAMAHEHAQEAAANGNFKEAYRLEQISRKIEYERAETDQFGFSVAKMHPGGLHDFVDYFSHFWWRIYGTYFMVIAVYIALVFINFIGWAAAPITRVALRIMS